MAKNLRMPTPSDVAYIEAGIHAYIMDVLRDKKVDYRSPDYELRYNLIVAELRERICASIQPK